MTIDSTHSDPAAPARCAPRLGRRTLLTGFGFGAAAIVVAKTGGSAGAVAGELNGPGQALAQAQRVATTSTTTTTTTTTVPTGSGDEDDAPVGDAIPFPIVVGEDDTCYVGDNFGACRSGCSRSHEGVDIMADRGLEVIAVADGTLTKIYEDSGERYGAGNGWTLTDEVNEIVYKFFHLDSHAEGLEEGDTVTAGQVIGYIGETGTSGVDSTQENFHLHFEYRPYSAAQESYVARNAFGLLERPDHVRFAS